MGSTSTATQSATQVARVTPDLSAFRLKQERSAVYWCGVIPGREAQPEKDGRPAVSAQRFPPQHSFDAIGGGVTFTEWYTPDEGAGQDGQPRRGQYPGRLVRLTETQVALLVRGLSRTLVRWRERSGRHAHGYLVRIPAEDEIEDAKKRLALDQAHVAKLLTKLAQFTPTETDEPAARFIYCVKVDGPDAVPGGTWRPSMHIPRSIEEAGTVEAP